MNFLRRHWKGIIILFVAGLVVYLLCYYFIPKPKDVRITMPFLIDVTILVFSQIFKMDYKKWPWQLNWKEWQKIWETEKSRRSCT